MNDLLPLIDRSLVLLDALDAHDTTPEVRGLRARVAELEAGVVEAVESADELHGRLVRELADGTITPTEAGELLVDLNRRREGQALAAELYPAAAQVVRERLHRTAAEFGDGWIEAFRPAVDRLAEALDRASKLSDGHLLDVAAGTGTPSQRALVAEVTAALRPALEAQDLADELRQARIVPTHALRTDPFQYGAAFDWQDVTPLERAAEAWRGATGEARKALKVEPRQVPDLIRLRRDRGAVPALLTAAEVVNRPGPGPRHAAQEAERRLREQAGRAAAEEEHRAHLAMIERTDPYAVP